MVYKCSVQDAYPKGEIYIGSKGFEVTPGTSGAVKHVGFAFTLKTPERSFQFSAETEDDRKDWMRILGQVIEDPTR